MSNIEELQQRITAAMDRIAHGVSKLDGAGAAEANALRAALEEEKTVTAQLEERVSALKQKHAEERDASESALAALAEKIEALDLELQKLRQANDQLRASNAALRAANESGVGDPELINAGLAAELETLQAAREVERAEAEAILTALAPALNAQEESTDA